MSSSKSPARPRAPRSPASAPSAAVAERRSGGTVSYIVKDVEEAIRSGRLVLGQRLVEADLARELRVSRGSLREALNRLATAGLVEIVPNRGAVVRRLTRKEVADRYQIRAQLEGLAASLAAQRLHEADHRERLLSVAPPDAAQISSVEEYRRENYRLHEMIADLSGNPQLAALIRQLWLPAHMVELRGSLDATFHRDSAEDHRRIVDAILSQDAAAAEAAMQAHLEARCRVILSLPSRVFGE
nr:GntR family transcriptional regulator [Roseococcus sp. MDT2-1-1]